MDRERAKELAPIIAAYGEGKMVQFRLPNSPISEYREWMTVDSFTFEVDGSEICQYRIKPEPREYWLLPYTDKLGYRVCETHYSQWAPEANGAGLNFAGIIHVREVI